MQSLNSYFIQTGQKNTIEQYQMIKKPDRAPPPKVYGIVRSFLYPIIIAVLIIVIYKWYTKQLPMIILLPFLINIVLNIMFTPIQFGLKNNFLSVIDIVWVLITIIRCMIAIYPYSKWLSYIQIPYLIWVSIATTLMIQIRLLNR